MNIDRSGKIGCESIVKPIIVREPGIRFRKHNQFTAAGVIKFKFDGAGNTGNSGYGFQCLGDLIDHAGIAHIDVC